MATPAKRPRRSVRVGGGGGDENSAASVSMSTSSGSDDSDKPSPVSNNKRKERKEETVSVNPRREMYNSIFQKLKMEVKAMEDKWNEKTVLHAQQFMESSGRLLRKEDVSIPIAFVPIGSSEENRTVFDCIETEVLSHTRFCARLTAERCNNVKTAFQTVCKQLLAEKCNVSHVQDSTWMQQGRDFDISSESESEDVGIVPKTSRGLGIHELVQYVGQRDTNQVVIMVENADYFAHTVLPQLIHLLSSSKLRLCFIVGVSQCVPNVGRFIPLNSSAVFLHSTFETVPSQDRFNLALQKILDIDTVPIMLGPSVVQYLVRYFETQHTSLTRLLQAFQLCLIEHSKKPESLLCKELANHKPSSDFAAIELKKILRGLDQSSINLPIQWNFALNIVSRIQVAFDGSGPTFIEIFRNLYVAVASGTFYERQDDGQSESGSDKLMAEIKHLPKTGLVSLIQRLCMDLGIYINNDDAKFGFVSNRSTSYTSCEMVQNTVIQLKDILANSGTLSERENAEKEEAESQGKKNQLKLKKKMTLAELRDVMKPAANSGSKALQELRNSFADFVGGLLKSHLKPFKKLFPEKIYSAFVFDDVQTLKQLFSPDTLSYVTNSLTCPSKVLECKCCANVDANSMSPSQPDVSIIFKLLKEQMHKKVDLNIIYQAFEEIIQSANYNTSSRKGKQKKQAPTEDSILLRFRQAVAELQFVGVLKRSRTNPDEITKLIWG